ncbi:MAG: hypothetical protein AB7O59_18520 [Pirellulales bacterium]
MPRSPGAQLLHSVLVACESPAVEIEQAHVRYAQLLARLETHTLIPATPLVRARRIHAFLHAEVLRGEYAATASDLATTLQGGPYNCAGACALFLALARDCDLSACAVSVSGHVWCAVETAEGAYHVEMTCPDWFNLAAGPGVSAAAPSTETAAFWTDHSRRVADGRRLNDRQFAAIFPFNRGVGLLREGEYSAAVVANLAALARDCQSTAARDNLAAALTGWTDGATVRRPSVASDRSR